MDNFLILRRRVSNFLVNRKFDYVNNRGHRLHIEEMERKGDLRHCEIRQPYISNNYKLICVILF